MQEVFVFLWLVWTIFPREYNSRIAVIGSFPGFSAVNQALFFILSNVLSHVVAAGI